MKLYRIKNLLTDSIAYGLGRSITKLIGFLLIPVYTSHLSPADYGVLALVVMLGDLLARLFGLGLQNAVFRFYFKESDRPTGQAEVIGTYLFIVATLVIPFAAIAFSSRPIAGFLLGSASFWSLVALTCALQYLGLLGRAPLVIIRALRKTTTYLVVTLSRALLTISMTIVLVVSLQWNVFGVLTAQVTSSLIFTTVLLALFMRKLPLAFSRRTASQLLRFGLPLVPAQMLYFVFRFSNRYFLSELVGFEDVGLFSLGNRFGEMILLLNASIQTAWPIFLYGSEKDDNAPALYARAMTYYVALSGLVASAIVLFSPELYRLMVRPRFHLSIVVVPFSCITCILMGVQTFGNVGINLREKTHYSIIVAVASATTSVTMNLLLIPRFGILGAAWATIAAAGVQSSVTLWYSLKLYRIRYEVRRILILVGVFVMVAVVGRSVPVASPPLLVAVKLLFLALGVPSLLLALRFYTPEEMRKARSLLPSGSRSGQ